MCLSTGGDDLPICERKKGAERAWNLHAGKRDFEESRSVDCSWEVVHVMFRRWPCLEDVDVGPAGILVVF